MENTERLKIVMLALIVVLLQAGYSQAEIPVATVRSTVLYGIKAATVTGALGQAHGRHLSWKGNGALSWDISVPADGRYELYLTADVHERAGGQVFTFKTPDKELDFRLEPTTGMTLIGRRFQRRVLSSGIDLKKGTQTIEFFVEDVPGKGALLEFRSLELLPLSAKERIAAEYERAVASRSSVDWLRDAGYGLMFHWTSQSVQPDGSRKPFAEAVDDFDVDQFVNMVEETGAGYVIFTIGHAESYCPAPIKSWENVHPGKTTDRDLIHEIATTLGKRNVRLICYINGPLGLNSDVKGKASDRDREVFVENFQNILVEMGNRYKEKVVGYWFDSWNRIFEEFPDVPFETFFQAAKAGNPDRIFCLNSWVYPPVTPWQDYWAGEVRSPFALPVDGTPVSGAVTDLPYQTLLIMEPYWVQKKAEMPNPRFAAEDLSEYILNCMKNKGAVTVNLGIYQDGTVGEKALQVMRDVKEKVRGYRLKRKKTRQQARSVSENPVVGPRASGFGTGKDGEAGDIGVYRRCSRTQSSHETSRSKPDRILRQAPRAAQQDDRAEPGHKESISTTGSHRPDFSWVHVPLYMHMRKSAAFTAAELDYLAGFPLITLEKTTGSQTYGSSEDGSREAAKAIKAVNKDACVLYYRNVMCNYASYRANEGLKDIPSPFLVARNGNTKLHRGRREVYDLSNPALRKWWVDHCVEMAGYDEIDGLFLDGNIKALELAFLGKEIGLKRKQEVAEGYLAMMQDLKDRIPSDKMLVANIIRARLTDSGLSTMQYFDGSYLEGIESAANGLTRLEYLAKGIDAIQQAARQGKIICMSIGLGKASLTGLKIDDSRKKLARGANIQPRLEYCLALFLICAEQYSYFLAHDGYSVNNNDSSVWLTRFPEYDKPLGPPKGPAVQAGTTYTREFESASVFLDIEKETAKITWK